MTLPDFEAGAIFAKVVQTGSFSQAAADLGLQGDRIESRCCGLAVLPEFLVWKDVQAGRLQIVLCDWSLPPSRSTS